MSLGHLVHDKQGGGESDEEDMFYDAVNILDDSHEPGTSSESTDTMGTGYGRQQACLTFDRLRNNK